MSPIRSLQPIALTPAFIPRSLGDHSGPIISIPPPTKGARFYPTSQKKIIINRKSEVKGQTPFVGNIVKEEQF